MKILLVVDMQKGFMTKPNYINLQKKIDELICKNDYDKYIFTRFINKNNPLYRTKLNWDKLSDKKSQEICVPVPENSVVFNKSGYGLDIKDLEKIKQLGISKIDICGLQTDACVYAIALQLWDNHIFPNILKNYVATTPSRENQAIEMTIHQFGAVDERQ